MLTVRGEGRRAREKLGDAIVMGPAATLSMDSTARWAEDLVRVRPGMRRALPLGENR